MSIETYQAERLERLLAAPRGEQQGLASAIGYFTCIVIAVQAHPGADPRRQKQIATLLARLYRWLVQDGEYPARRHWPKLVEENYWRFHRKAPLERLADGLGMLFELTISIPIVGLVVMGLLVLFAAAALGLLYLVLLPFPKLHERVTRRMDAWTTVAENAQ